MSRLSEARTVIERHDPDLVISDVVLPDLSGLELLKHLKGQDSLRPVILITAHGSIDAAVDAMKSGADDFLTKPLDYAKLQVTVRAALEELRHRREIGRVESMLDAEPGFGALIGMSPSMREVYRLIEQLAESDASAIITGESGTGKELAARTVHDMGTRRNGPFVAINTAAIPDGLVESEVFGHEKGAFTGAAHPRPGCFELADGGTLLLDEIAEMPATMQPKLLRILESGRARRVGGTRERSFDVRVLAATNQDPAQSVEDGKLREDLLYRLNVFHITLPPLREHMEDLSLLAQHFIRIFNEKHDAAVSGVGEEARELLGAYRWTGNVRELRNVLERATILARAGWIDPTHLPPYLRESGNQREDAVVLPLGISAAEAEKRLILKTLEVVGYNKAAAARQLGIDVKTIRNKLKLYGES
jgi:DNA-binding NtrC family response regulator